MQDIRVQTNSDQISLYICYYKEYELPNRITR